MRSAVRVRRKEEKDNQVNDELSKTAQTIPDWVAKVFDKELHAAKQQKKPRRGR